jgi:hypothetical protein
MQPADGSHSQVMRTAALFQLAVLTAAAATPAFPGAEGFGAQTPGGRGGRVLVRPQPQ